MQDMENEMSRLQSSVNVSSDSQRDSAAAIARLETKLNEQSIQANEWKEKAQMFQQQQNKVQVPPPPSTHLRLIFYTLSPLTLSISSVRSFISKAYSNYLWFVDVICTAWC